MIDTLGFDADDTLWHNETLFSLTQAKLRAILAPFASSDVLDKHLLETEQKNIVHFGYGIKGFTLSMIETAIALSGGRIDGAAIQQIVDAGKAMFGQPVELLDGVRETLERLAGPYRLMIVTKGDLFDQESKVARSGLGPLFAHVEVVSEKDPATYRRILARHGIAPGRFMMIGNSVRSDVLPVVAIGARAVHVPYHVEWQHEVVEHRGAVAEGFDVNRPNFRASGAASRLTRLRDPQNANDESASPKREADSSMISESYPPVGGTASRSLVRRR